MYYNEWVYHQLRKLRYRRITQEDMQALKGDKCVEIDTLDARCIDFGEMDLTPHYLAGGYYDYSNFAGARLNSDMSGTGLNHCNFSHADVNGCWFDGSEAAGATFRGAKARACDFNNMQTEGICFRNADLRDSTIWLCSLYRADLRGADMRGCDLKVTCWPLSRLSYGVHVDRRIFAQLAHHLCNVVVDDEECKAAQDALRTLASEFEYTYDPDDD